MENLLEKQPSDRARSRPLALEKHAGRLPSRQKSHWGCQISLARLLQPHNVSIIIALLKQERNSATCGSPYGGNWSELHVTRVTWSRQIPPISQEELKIPPGLVKRAQNRGCLISASTPTFSKLGPMYSLL